MTKGTVNLEYLLLSALVSLGLGFALVDSAVLQRQSLDSVGMRLVCLVVEPAGKCAQPIDRSAPWKSMFLQRLTSELAGTWTAWAVIPAGAGLGPGHRGGGEQGKGNDDLFQHGFGPFTHYGPEPVVL